MKEMDFLNGINDLEPELLEDSAKAKRGVRPKSLRFAAIAAALLLVLGGTTVYAIRSGVKLTDISEPDGEQGYSAEATVPLVKWKDVNGEVKNAGSEIARQYREFAPEPAYSSLYVDPGSCSVSFSTISEALDYVGLAGLKTPSFPYDDIDACSVTAHGDAEGRIDSIRVYIEHVNAQEMSAQEYVTILTEYAKDGELVSKGFWSPEFPLEAEFSYYTTPGGSECSIAVLRPVDEDERMGVTGYVVSGSALYELHLGNLREDDYDRAIRIIHDWADALDRA